MKQLNDCLTPFNKHKHELYFPEVNGYPLLVASQAVGYGVSSDRFHDV